MMKFVIVWIVLGVLSAGFQNAYWRKDHAFMYETKDDASGTCLLNLGLSAALGPIAIATTLFTTSGWRYGWTLTCGPLGQSYLEWMREKSNNRP